MMLHCDMSASVEQTPQEIVKDRGVWLAAVRGITEEDMTSH